MTMQWTASPVVVAAFLVAAIAWPPTAAADSTDDFRTAVVQAHGGNCGALSANPTVDKAADIVTNSNEQWLNFTARVQPVPEPLPVLKDLGYGGSKASMAQGAGLNAAQAIKATLLEASRYYSISDCSYTDYGVSIIQNQRTELWMTALVLAGP